MTTSIEDEEKMWKVISENKGKRIRIVIGNIDIILESWQFFIDDFCKAIVIRDSDYNLDIIIAYEDIKEIWDSFDRELLYRRE